jgi:hypothetical protein
VLSDAAASTPTGSLFAEARGCPVTEPQPAPGSLATDLFGGGSAYGNDDLWVGGLWPHGVITAGGAFIDRRGAVRMKFGWWRETPGTLTIGGKRLDAPGPPLSAIVPTGYGASGFQASSIRFPTEGCWEVTGRVGEGALTFVTYVIKLD